MTHATLLFCKVTEMVGLTGVRREGFQSYSTIWRTLSTYILYCTVLPVYWPYGLLFLPVLHWQMLDRSTVHLFPHHCFSVWLWCRPTFCVFFFHVCSCAHLHVKVSRPICFSWPVVVSMLEWHCWWWYCKERCLLLLATPYSRLSPYTSWLFSMSPWTHTQKMCIDQVLTLYYINPVMFFKGICQQE